MASWSWSESAHRYRNLGTGRFLSASAERELRDDFVNRSTDAVATLATRVTAGEITPDEWERGVRSHVRLVNTAQYLFGRGGKNAMTADDNAALATLVRDQWTYLGSFAGDVAAGALSEAQIRARSRLYVNAARSAYEQGRSASYAGLVLPAHPADGSTTCRASCGCAWVIKDTETAWECTWEIDGGRESCDDCVERAAEWAPLVIPKEAA